MRRRVGPIVGVLPLIVLAVLLLLPPTGWIVRQQMSLQFLPSPALRCAIAALGLPDRSGVPADPPAEENERLRAALGRWPRDASSVLAIAWGRPNADGSSVLAELRSQLPSLGSDPALHAGILRFYSMGQMRVSRLEESEWASYNSIGQVGPSKPSPPDAAVIQGFLESARAGERLDPDNAYFPFMEAVGLLAARKDAEALAALGRAARRNGWNDYTADEARARTRGCDAAFGRQSALVHVGTQASILFPHYARMRSVVRVAIAIAAARERSGRPDEGLAIRHDVMRVGALMRARSTSAIGSLVGCALTDMAAENPGDSADQSAGPLSPEARRDRRNEAYLAALRRRGLTREAAWEEEQLGMAARVRAILAEGLPRTTVGPRFARSLTNWWVAGCILAAHVVWLLLMAALCGTCAALRGQVWFKAALAVVGFLAVGWLSVRAASSASSLEAIGHALEAMAGSGGQQPGADTDKAMRGLVMLGVMAVPLFATGIVAAVRMARDKPVLGGMPMGFCIAAVVVLLAYGGVLAATEQREEVAAQAIAKMLASEGRYSAEKVGRLWPDVEPPPPPPNR